MKLSNRLSKNSFILLFAVVIMSATCNDKRKGDYYQISTKFGDMTIHLFDETPLHRDNFKKLVEQGFYDSLLFHRVMADFMIQGGDPESKGAKMGARLGEGGPGYKIPAEIIDTLFHYKGVLAAARQSDQVNPKKESSGSQFYIVQGKKYSLPELKQMETSGTRYKQQMAQQACANNLENEWIKFGYQRAVQANNQDSVAYFQQQMQVKLTEAVRNADSVVFSQRQIDKYTQIGGTPHLDGEYTVFGEVIEGLNIIDSIGNVAGDKQNRPLEDIIFSIKAL